MPICGLCFERPQGFASQAVTIVEAWLQAKVKNENRGRMMGIYRVVDISGSLAAQLLSAF